MYGCQELKKKPLFNILIRYDRNFRFKRSSTGSHLYFIQLLIDEILEDYTKNRATLIGSGTVKETIDI